MFQTIRSFYQRTIDTGDRLGETFYGIWMAVVSIGLLNSEGAVTPATVLWVVGVAFSVNITWGVIDGVTVMFTNIIERARQDRIFAALGGNPADRDELRDHLAGTVLSRLPPAEREAVIDRLAAESARLGPPPRVSYRPRMDDWAYVLGIVLIDFAVVVPVVTPLILLPDLHLGVYVSRLVATTMFALVGAAYARALEARAPPLVALQLGACGYLMFSLAYQSGW